jgi:hypothetical protein
MALNPYFNKYEATNEQDLLEGLIIESIQIHGMEIVYVPKTLVDFDKLYGEDAQRAFLAYFTIEAFFENVEGWMGDKNFLNKFGLNIDKQAVFNISKKRFDEEVKMADPTILRPQEGDLIYIPITKDLMEITMADHEEVFYQLGKIYVWKLTCEKFRFSHETVDTGNADIDDIVTELESSDDPLADNDEIQTRIEDFLDPDRKLPE